MPDTYMIGTTYGGLTALSSLATPVRLPKYSYMEYSKPLPLGSGLVRGGGWATAEWHWDVISAAERDMLKTFCTGASAFVYIMTRRNVNTGSGSALVVDSYLPFYCVMVFPVPQGERDFTGIRKDFTIKFHALIDASPS
jgi:hypothetical protein